jgi:hypothetical protein
MRSNALQESQDVAGFIGDSLVEEGWVEQWVHLDNFLKQCCNGPDRVPDEWSKFCKVLSLLAQGIQGIVPFIRVFQFIYLLDY